MQAQDRQFKYKSPANSHIIRSTCNLINPRNTTVEENTNNYPYNAHDHAFRGQIQENGLKPK